MIATALLLLGSCGSASRTIEVEPEIRQILVRVIIGGVRDVLLRRRDSSAGFINSGVLRSMSLRIDGRPRTGPFAWAAGINRVAGYALDRRTDGSVEYAYRLRIHGFDIRRNTRISDGMVSLVTDVYGAIGPRGEVTHVRLRLLANEINGATRISGTATGWSDIGSRCGIVNRIASREIAKAMRDDMLAVLERGGRRLYERGDLHAIVSEFIERLKTK